MNVETAEKIARILHEDQFRADGVTPYIEHPKAVAELVKEYGGSERWVRYGLVARYYGGECRRDS